MKSILVIGIGSRIMADDAIGVHLVEDLEKLDTVSNIRYLAGETDVYCCISEIPRYDYIVVIDAFLSGKKAGEVTIVPFHELKDVSEDSLYSMHGIHLLNMIRHAENLPEGMLIGIEPFDINYGLDLSDALQSCYPNILRDVQIYLSDILKNREGRKKNA